MMTIEEVIRTLEEWFPPRLAESWDNVGFLLGSRNREARRILTCLTLTPNVADEAIEAEADLIVSHHPIWFRAVQRLTADGPDAHLYRLARAGVGVYSPHTAFDSAAGGINQQIGAAIGLEDVQPIRPAPGPDRCKLVVFVPESDLEKVQSAIFESGGGVIGEYSECSFRLAGTGTFFGSERSDPTVGRAGSREEVAELRLEVLIDSSRVEAAVAAMIRAHSYEEPAYDVYPLRPGTTGVGGGRMGRLAEPASLAELAARAKVALAAGRVDLVGDPERPCRSVAVACGAGAEFLEDAIAAKCDVLLTGEARFHQLLQAEANSLALLLAGHYATERFAVEGLARRLSAHWPSLAVWPSEREHDPIRRSV